MVSRLDPFKLSLKICFTRPLLAHRHSLSSSVSSPNFEIKFTKVDRVLSYLNDAPELSSLPIKKRGTPGSPGCSPPTPSNGVSLGWRPGERRQGDSISLWPVGAPDPDFAPTSPEASLPQPFQGRISEGEREGTCGRMDHIFHPHAVRRQGLAGRVVEVLL